MITIDFFGGNERIGSRDRVLEGDRAVGADEFFHSCRAAGELLDKNNIQAFDRVGLLGRNSFEFVVLLLALWYRRAVACPMNRRLPSIEIAHQCRRLGCKAFFSDDPRAISPHDAGCKVLPFSLCAGRLPRAASLHGLPELLPDADATIMHTTGSSGSAKAALHTLGNHLANARGSNEHIALGPADAWLLSLPLFHAGGMGILFRTLLAGARLAIPSSDESFVNILARGEISHLSVVQTQLLQLIETAEKRGPFSSLKAVLAGGSAISPDLVRRAVALRVPLYLTYGSTEMGSQIATTRIISHCDPEPGYDILPFRQLTILEQGQIGVKGPCLFKGYVTGAGVEQPVDSDGWWQTGDRGKINEDGTLAVTGRIDRMLISGGENIQPEEVEKVLCANPLIEAAAVVAVRDLRYGQRPVAFVAAKNNAEVNKNMLCAYLRANLPSFSVPDRFFLLPAKFRNSYKIDYRGLAQKAEQGEGLEELR